MATRKRKTTKRASDQISLDLNAEDAAPAAASSNGKARPTRSARGASSRTSSAPASSRRGGRARGASTSRTAQDMAKGQREISVSEFFAKNRHLLGFDNPKKALLTTIKEAVDNALDACEEARILPELRVEIHELREGRYRIVVQDNGPGIVKSQIPRIFGQLLYGSKFHARRQSRGQQGIGISAAGMYGQLTTGKAMRVISRAGKRHKAFEFAIQIDTNKNAPLVSREAEIEWEPGHGTRIELELEGLYQKGKRSVDGYIEATALANPHARITYVTPKIPETIFERTSPDLPIEPREIKPHPHGIELGLLMKMLKETKSRTVSAFLHTEFSRVSAKVSGEIVAGAGLKPNASPARIHRDAAEELYQSIQSVKIMAPPTDCLSPIGPDAMEAGLRAQVNADIYLTTTRAPSVYRGNPFQVEVGIAYGGDLPGDELITLHRFANRVPLLYQQSACACSKAVIATAWRNYGLSQSRGAFPAAPMVLFMHIASVWVPFTSESKEAIAHYPEILKEMRLALQDCGRKLGQYLKRRKREADSLKKRAYIEKYIPHIGIALEDILGLTEKQKADIIETLTDTLERSRKL